MVLKKVSSSGITEVVIAVTIIASCFSIGVLVYSRSSQLIFSFEEIQRQTHLQSILWKHQIEDSKTEELKKLLDSLEESDRIEESNSPEIAIYTFKRNNGNLLWQQEVLK